MLTVPLCVTACLAPVLTRACACSRLIHSIHEYQRHGGMMRQFEQLDRSLTDYLVSSTEVPDEVAGEAAQREGAPITRRTSRTGSMAQPQQQQTADNGAALAEQ